ncbi:energy transducer TonB [Hymenobacter busanensis]|uniref:Energy transducer TonB n=1 Tax=Hymenobacter busanensis TaxID=2607656 RepID=A0A7L4ZXX9_9BACT|nr:energy transducer TonB [Hymenobacter busanensis]KAA9339156.1 energy transducer TonB [Hymenobacter busanensis]QHJ07082.1 TonB family protein [Hymenobacter busanensis]
MYRSLLLLVTLSMLGAATARAQENRTLTINSGEAGSAAQVTTPAAPAIYHTADVMPAFPGGTEAFGKFLREKLQYPTEALNKGRSGKVYVQFVVDERGHIIDPQVVKGLGAGLDQEALRLVRIMPWWTPGLVGGQPVKVAYTLPIVFRALE